MMNENMMYLQPWCKSMNDNANSITLTSAEKNEAESRSLEAYSCGLLMAEHQT